MPPMNPHHENPAHRREPEAQGYGPASGHGARPQGEPISGDGMEVPWWGTDEAQRDTAENGAVDSGSDEPQDQSAAPEDEAIADEALLDSARAGDEQSYAVLYERHRSTALNVARMHTRNVHDAEDLVSEAFARILSVLRRGGGPRKYMRSYLVATIGRLAVDHGMAAGRVRPSGDDAELDRPEEFDDVVVRQCEAAVVATAYGSLPERWQAVLWHTEVEGMKPAAVAEELQISPNAVSALAKRARQGLQSAYLQAQVSAEATDACPEFAGELGSFAAGTLAARRRSKLQQHLDDCPRCTAEYLQLEDVGVGMRVWILPVLAALPLWGTESKVLTAILASGTGSAAMAGGASSADGAAEVTGGLGQGSVEPSAAASVPLDGGVAAGSAAAAGPAGSDSVGSGSQGGKLAVGATVAGGIGLKVAVGVVAAAAAVSLVGLGVSTLVRDDAGGASAVGGLPFPAGDGAAEGEDDSGGDDSGGGESGADSAGSLFGDSPGDGRLAPTPAGDASTADPGEASDGLAAFEPADEAEDQRGQESASSGSESASAGETSAGESGEAGGTDGSAASSSSAASAASGSSGGAGDSTGSGGSSESGASGDDSAAGLAGPSSGGAAQPADSGGAVGGSGGSGDTSGGASDDGGDSGGAGGDTGGGGTTDPAPQPLPTGEPTSESTSEPTAGSTSESTTEPTADPTATPEPDPGATAQPEPTEDPTEPSEWVTPPATDYSADPTDPATDPGDQPVDSAPIDPGSGSTDPNQPPAEVEGATWVWVPREQWPWLWRTLWPWTSGYWELSADTA